MQTFVGSLVLLILPLTLMAQVVAQAGDATIVKIGKAAGFYSLSHPEYPPLPELPVKSMLVYPVPNTDGSGTRWVFDDRGWINPTVRKIVNKSVILWVAEIASRASGTGAAKAVASPVSHICHGKLAALKRTWPLHSNRKNRGSGPCR